MGKGKTFQPQVFQKSKDEELKMLEEQAKAMQEQLKQITQKIEELNKDKETKE